MAVQPHMEKMIQELENRKAKILLAGGKDKIEKQHQSGKLSARERIDNLLDSATFVETDMFVHHRCDNFGMEKVEAPDDGVVTGYGKIEGARFLSSPRTSRSSAGLWGKPTPPRSSRSWTWPLKWAPPSSASTIRAEDASRKGSTPNTDTAGFFTATRSIPGSSRSSRPSWALAPEGPSIRRPLPISSS